MNAAITREARAYIPPSKDCAGTHPVSATVMIDGSIWNSPTPSNAGEAQAFNEDARRIVEALKRKP